MLTGRSRTSFNVCMHSVSYYAIYRLGFGGETRDEISSLVT